MREKESPHRRGERAASESERPLTPDVLAGDGPEPYGEGQPNEDMIPIPSQAEGDRETVEEDLRAHASKLPREPHRHERRSGRDRRRRNRRSSDQG